MGSEMCIRDSTTHLARSDGVIVFFVASRGHHADIGGISPGSMPPHSKLLVEEGAAVVSFKIVREGEFQVWTHRCGQRAMSHCEVSKRHDLCQTPRTPQEEGVSRLLMAPGDLAASVPGISGTRNLSDNLSDLRAQV